VVELVRHFYCRCLRHCFACLRSLSFALILFPLSLSLFLSICLYMLSVCFLLMFLLLQDFSAVYLFICRQFLSAFLILLLLQFLVLHCAKNSFYSQDNF